jgi:hypothetical protein
MQRILSGLVTLLGVLYAHGAFAQVLYNPSKAEFVASVDHATVTSYEIGWFLGAATDPVSSQNLGKPTPASGSNLCLVPITVAPLSFNTYIAKVRAIAGAATSVWSDPSNAFQTILAMTTAQKVKLSITAVQNGGPVVLPPSQIITWTVNGDGTFVPIAGEVAAWFVPTVMAGVYTVTAQTMINAATVSTTYLVDVK